MAGDGWLLGALPEDERRLVLASMRRRRFARGEVVFHEGDPGDTVHFIDKGHVAIRVSTPLGDVATLTVLGPGDGFGEGALLADDSLRTASAVAIGATETRTLHRQEFERLRSDHPQVERLLTDVLAAQVRRLSEHLLEALYVPAETRVLRRLLMLCGTYPAAADGTTTAPITQDDLATMAGTARPTANRVLQAAQDEGLVVLGRGRVTVVDRAGLERRAR